MRIVPPVIVDRMPVDWWRPGNLHRLGPLEIHFCDDDHVRTIEINGKTIGQGRTLFPYGRWDS